jgi:hypothetical protein
MVVSALASKVAATAQSGLRRTKDDLETVLPLDNSVDTPAPSRSPAPAHPSGLAPTPEIEYPPAENETRISIAEEAMYDR